MESKIKEITLYASQNLKKNRFEHSVRVAQTCEKLCKKYNLDSIVGYCAGISHDICKEEEDFKMISYALRDTLNVSEIERKKPSLLHGRAAAVLLKEKFGILNEEIIEAVQNHTFGKPNMCDIAKILYVADKIEPGRECATPKYLAKLEKLSLNELVLAVLNENISYLQSKNKSIAPITFELKEWLEKNL